MEIADVFVVNKADRPGARDTVREIRQMLDMSDAEYKPEVVQTVSTKGEGFDELWAAIIKHRNYQDEKGLLEARRRRRIEREIKEIVAEQLRRKVETEGSAELQRLTDEVVDRACNPYQAADRLLEAIDIDRM